LARQVDESLPVEVQAFDTSRGGKFNMRPMHIACGSTLTAVITIEGSLFAWGMGENVFSDVDSSLPKHMCPHINNFTQVACGRSHIMLLDVKGDVYAFGHNSYGQLGEGSRKPSLKLRLVLKGKSVESVACGRYHSLAAAACGTIYSWGCGEAGQLGHDSDHETGQPIGNIAIPRVISSLKDRVIGQLACGEHHCCAISSGKMQFPSDPWIQMSYYEDLEYQPRVVNDAILTVSHCYQ
jgi:alpha-tubulin suppressor-like RCC1 family protein